MTLVSIRPYYIELNQHLLHTRFIANQGDNREGIPEDHWSCIAHLSAEDMLKSAVNEEKKFKQSDFIHIFS